MKTEVDEYDDKYYHQILKLKLKEEDKLEVQASSGMPARRVLQRIANQYSKSMFVILYDGKVSGIFGVVPSGQPGIGIGYLLTNDEIKNYRFAMAKYTVPVFIRLLQQFPVITNYVSSEHKTSIKWLKRFGAHFDGKAYILHDPKVPFYKFELRISDYV